jgi:hypothetical protein
MSCGYRFGSKAHLAAMVKRLENAKLPVFWDRATSWVKEVWQVRPFAWGRLPGFA